MKKTLLLFIVFLYCEVILGQTNPTDSIQTNATTIGLVMPEEINGISADAFHLLESKLIKNLTNVGVATDAGNFVLFPTIDIIEENLIEAGTRNFHKIKLDLTLKVVNISSKTVFAAESWTLVGSAERNPSAAAKNAFSQMKNADPKFRVFIENTKTKISEYYIQNKKKLFAEADALSTQGDYEQAIAILYSYPAEADGYEEVQEYIRRIFVRYLDVNGDLILNEARAAYANKNYAKAVEIASQVDPESTKYSAAVAFINQVRAKVDKDEAEAHAREMQKLQLSADVEKQRILADKERDIKEMEVNAEREKTRLQAQAAADERTLKKMEIEADVEKDRIKANSELAEKKLAAETSIEKDRIKAETKIAESYAKAESNSMKAAANLAKSYYTTNAMTYAALSLL